MHTQKQSAKDGGFFRTPGKTGTVVLLVSLFLGVLYGSALICQGGGRFAVFRTAFWQQISTAAPEAGFWPAFGMFLQFGLLFWVLFACLGLMAGGQVLTVLVLFCCGLGFGARLGGTYLQQGVFEGLKRGMPQLLGAALVFLVLLLAAREALSLQTALWRVLCGRQNALRLQAVRLYGCKQLLLAVLLAVVSAIGGLLACALGG